MNVYIGAHMSISKGFHEVPSNTRKINANTFQIFPQSPRIWKNKLPDLEESELFKENMRKEAISFDKVLVHSSYLINLASPREDVREKSIKSLISQINIVSRLGLKYINIHPGSYLYSTLKEGTDKIAEAIDFVFNQIDDKNIEILLENVAKKGTNIGVNFEELKDIIDRTAFKNRMGITYDTCHGFDSNYDITTDESVENLLSIIDKELGIKRLKMIHLNDSKFSLGAGKDRHECFGDGNIAKRNEGFKPFLRNKIIQSIPWLLETPGNDENHKEEIIKIKSLMGW